MTLLALGIFGFVGIALSIFLLCRERKAKDLGPRALAKEFAEQSEERR